ncbi:hypothetical protein DFH06DRAFT_1338072 [Mycena polygramma]|nr:hypothetical protein DFH06DRAFT_1338072 [Mycena polygramma]
MTAPTQALPAWLPYTTITLPQTTETSVVYLPLTYYPASALSSGSRVDTTSQLHDMPLFAENHPDARPLTTLVALRTEMCVALRWFL